jgi:hypothetical protein
MQLSDIQRDHHLIKTVLIKNWSGAQLKKKMANQVYRVKYDGRKKKNSDLNSTIEKPITLLKNLAIDGKDMMKSSVDIPDTKSEP